MSIRTVLKRVIPRPLLNLRHLFYAWLGAFLYNHPSEKLFVIGVTGTSGKSSTVYFLRQILESVGFRVGALSTIEFSIAGRQKLNDKKMTMLGKMAIQRFLREMVKERCDIALIETTSEGRLQHRHRFINYDMMLLTNLYPEHVEAHGGFDAYKQAKIDIFRYVSRLSRKHLKNLLISRLPNSGSPVVPKTCIVNDNSEHASDFLLPEFDQSLLFGRDDQPSFGSQMDERLQLNNVQRREKGVSFSCDGFPFQTSVQGEHNAMNIAAALCVGRALKIEWPSLQHAVAVLQAAPGRIESIPEAEDHGFHVIVDYAFEPVAMEKLYAVVQSMQPKRIIHVFGSTGGGRDTSRRFTLGEFIGSRADVCVITDEDPYDDDPLSIINDVASAVKKAGKREGEGLSIIPDRADAIRHALDLAQAGDVILITGKGSEQGMVKKGKLIPWDDRRIVRDHLFGLY